jgi:hypothetical protein
VIEKSGPAHTFSPNVIFPTIPSYQPLSTPEKDTHARKFTVVPARRARLNVDPAGTVKPLMFTVVHATAAVTSESEEIVPVHAAAQRTANASIARDSMVRLWCEAWTRALGLCR